MSKPPDVVHVGFSKCASTFLQSFFSEHPQIFLVNQSHFFSPFEFNRFALGESEYSKLFLPAKHGQVRVESDEHILLPLFHPVLDAAATTMESVVEVSRRIRTIQPRTRIIIGIRNQLDLITSRYSEYVIGGGQVDFPAFVTEFLACSLDGINYFQNYYATVSEIFYNDFSPERVHIFLQEDLLRDEATVISRLCRFLNVDELQPSKRGIRARRVGLSVTGLNVVRKFNRAVVLRPQRSYHNAKVRLPYVIYKACVRALRILDYYCPHRFKGNKTALLTSDIVARIRGEFRGDNERLATLLGRDDLTNLGY